MSQMRILYVDAYDSFTNNIIGLLESTLDVSVTLVKIDDVNVASNLELFLVEFAAVVVGPGPGDPRNQEDVGFVNQLWELQGSSLIPILGICLGFQSLALAFGGRIERLRQPRHGLVTEVSHRGTDIFKGIIESFKATQYHSFHVILGRDLFPDPQEIYHATTFSPMLQPLAWDHDDFHNGPVLQALRHKNRPFWGLQYHPESICTAEVGARVVHGWWIKALEWLALHSRAPPIDGIKLSRHLCSRTLPLSGYLDHNVDHDEELDLAQFLETLTSPLDEHSQSEHISLPLRQLNVAKLCSGLNLLGTELILLDSQQTKGRYSIMGLVIPDQTLRLTYTMHSQLLRISLNGTDYMERYYSHVTTIWTLLQRILDINSPRARTESPTPFCGGLMGYISYEIGLDTVGVRTQSQSPRGQAPDFNLALVERSIVIDHIDNRIYIQSLLSKDNDWLSETSTAIMHMNTIIPLIEDHSPPLLSSTNHVIPTTDPETGLCSRTERSSIIQYFKSGEIQRPAEHQYCQNVLRCQEALRAGDSYELCLTDQTTVTIPENSHLDQPWILYQHLRETNPAPFGAYMRLGGCTILSSSPERFLSWDLEGALQMRPIKGTVKKSKDMNYSLAKSILDGSKERAENLMIVDLIRHDISGMIGAQNCKVSQLMQVEEYETVYQLVSVVEGQLPKVTAERKAANEADGQRHVNGIDVLRAALPPGSMVGAPKKRSCELLQEFEDQNPRGIYSGVLGYMDVRGSGDFSVIIRTAFRVDDEVVWKRKAPSAEINGHTPRYEDASEHGSAENGVNEFKKNGDQELLPHKVWRIGAGGAVTVQSTAQGEFQEMETKLDAILKIFHE